VWPVGGGTIEDMSATSGSGRLRGQDLLRAVAEGTAGAVGEEFLRGLARHVAEAFAAKLVLIAEASDPSGMHVRALACWYDGAFIEEPIEYDTAGQPCAVITEHPWVSFPEALTERFPNDRPAVELGLERRGRGSSRRPTPSGGASGATSTTARSSGSSRSRTCCASRA
jgi:hypothetical protein